MSMMMVKPIPEEAYTILSKSELDMLNRLNEKIESKPELNGRTTTLKIPDAAYTILSKSEIAVINRLVSMLADSVTNALEMSAEKLSEQMCYGVTTIKKAVNRLCGRGIITRTMEREKGQFLNTVWELHLEALTTDHNSPTENKSDTLPKTDEKALTDTKYPTVEKIAQSRKCPTVETALQEGSCDLSEIEQKMDIYKTDILLFADDKAKILKFVEANCDNPNIKINALEIINDINSIVCSIKNIGYYSTHSKGVSRKQEDTDKMKHALELFDFETFKRMAKKIRVNKPGNAINYIIKALLNNADTIDHRKETEVPQGLKDKLPQNDLTDKQIKHIIESIRRHNAIETDEGCIEELAKIIDYCRQNSDGPIINLYKYVMKAIEHPENISTSGKKLFDRKPTKSKRSSKSKSEAIDKFKEESRAFCDGVYIESTDYSDFKDDFGGFFADDEKEEKPTEKTLSDAI